MTGCTGDVMLEMFYGLGCTFKKKKRDVDMGWDITDQEG